MTHREVEKETATHGEIRRGAGEGVWAKREEAWEKGRASSAGDPRSTPSTHTAACFAAELAALSAAFCRFEGVLRTAVPACSVSGDGPSVSGAVGSSVCTRQRSRVAREREHCSARLHGPDASLEGLLLFNRERD